MVDKITNDKTGHDLNNTGTILELDVSESLWLGWNVTAGSAADYEVEIDVDDTTHTIDSYSSVTSIDDGVIAPEAKKLRIKNTTTVNDTADVALGGASL